MSDKNVDITLVASLIDSASRTTAGILIENLEPRTLNLPERTAARMVINRLPGMAFEVDVNRHGQDVAGLLQALEACGKELKRLYGRVEGLEALATQDRADKAALRRLMGL